MYFSGDKNDTNIDDEFKQKKSILLNPKKMTNKVKVFIVSALLVILLVVMIFFFVNREVTNYLVLNGEESITIYQGTDYIEPGFKAYNSKKEDLSSDVDIKSTLNTDKVGEYEIIYTLDENTVTRKINVIARSASYTYIYLKTVNNSVNVYLKVGEKYEEPGYQVFGGSGQDLTSKVKVTGTVDTSKKGNYKLTYSLVDENNVTVSATRTVIVMDTEISLTLNNEQYTNDKVTINVGIIDNYFDYIILPDNTKVTSSTYAYSVSENGKYTFTVYNTKGSSTQASIEVKNIDKTAPTGSCILDYNNNGSVMSISASDVSGIDKYVYNGKTYLDKNIILSSYIDSAKVLVYDKAGNSREVSCKSVALPVISSITNDGIIVTVNAKKLNSDISGYYFSYENKRPDKSAGGYIATNNESVEVVRLVGTTYVWVEDKSGKIGR